MSQALFCENPSYYFSKLPTNFKAVKNIFAVTAPSVARSDSKVIETVRISHISHVLQGESLFGVAVLIQRQSRKVIRKDTVCP